MMAGKSTDHSLLNLFSRRNNDEKNPINLLFSFLFFTFCNVSIKNETILKEFTKDLLMTYISDSLTLDFNSKTHNIVLTTYSDKNIDCISVYAYKKELFLPDVYYQTIWSKYNILLVGESNSIFLNEGVEQFRKNKKNDKIGHQLIEDNPKVWQICMYKNHEINPLRTYKVTPFEDISILVTLIKSHFSIDKTVEVLFNRDTLSATRVDKPPYFLGGDDSLKAFIKKGFLLPEEFISGERILILVGVTIDKNGKVRNPQIVKSSGILGLDNEALRLVSTLPDFYPASHRGIPVSVQYAISIEID